jgi:hypothetical protein
VKRVHSLNIRPSGFFRSNYQEIFTLKKTLATNAKGKRGGEFSSQCGKQWTLCPQGATHNEVMCRVMNKSQLFCERGSGMWQE